MTGPEMPAAATLQVVRGGEPSDEELAALVTVLTAHAAAAGGHGPAPLRQPLSPWVASGLTKGTRTKA